MGGERLADAASENLRYRRAMRSAVVPGFLPSVHGFRFANRWPAGPAFELRARYVRLGIGEVAEGLCGGMCVVAADRFLDGSVIPDVTAPPPPGSELFRTIARAQLRSLEAGLVPARFWLAAAAVRAGRWSVRAQRAEWRAVRRSIDGGRPAMVGLVRAATVNPFGLTRNHQVLAYACTVDGPVGTLSIYDPNHPGRDDVGLELRVEAGRISLGQSTGEPVLALLSLPDLRRRR